MTEMGGVKLRTPKVRDERIDAVKFWLIVLVIAVHVVMRKEFGGSRACVVLWNWMNLFLMPLFIFISGYFSRKKEWKNFGFNIWKLLEPLIIFHVIALVFYVKHPLSVRSILSPWYMLWYLLSLIYWRFLLQIIPDKILRHKKLIVISTFFISILAGFLPFDRVLSLQRTLAFMPFFFLGYYMRGRNLFLPDKYKPHCIVLLILIFAMLFFFPHRMNFLLNAAPYKSIYGAAIRMTALVFAIPVSIAFMNVCPKAPWIAKQGGMSMQYYIYHALIVPPNSAMIMPLLIVVADKMGIPFYFVTAVVITIGTVILIATALKIPYVKRLANPSLLFVKKDKNTTANFVENIHG